MASFVLVHGSGQSSRSWDRARPILEARGHHVAAPDLPKRASGWGMAEYAAEIARSVTRPGTVVVAHSLSGVLLPEVARSADCGLLVFLAAVIPEPGKSVRQQFTEDPGMFHADWIAAGPRWFEEGERESLAREFLFHDCDEETVSWALATLDPFETRLLVTQPVPQVRTMPPGVSIVAAEDRTLAAEWGRKMSERVLGRPPLVIRSGHCPHISRPEAIAVMLEELAIRHVERAGRGR